MGASNGKPRWWEGATLYQVYVRSWLDTNADGYFTAPALARVVADTLAALPAGECPVWTASNHDISRFPSRWCGGGERKARLALLVLSMLPGTLVLYYGDEIGMTDLDVPPRSPA